MSTSPVLVIRLLSPIGSPCFSRRANGRRLVDLQVEVCYICCLFHAGFLLGLLFDPEDGGDIFPKRFTFAGLQVIISQNTELLISSNVFHLSLMVVGPKPMSSKNMSVI
jgi:hypothetical protein